jgi:hypothetical protein
MLTDIIFYKTEFYGNTIPEDEFAKYESMAEDKIHALTFDRLAVGLPSDSRAAERVQKGVCALADLLYQINTEMLAQTVTADGNGSSHRAVSSITAGSESISYVTNSTSAIGKAAADVDYKNRLIYLTVSEYLSNVSDDKGVNLLYAGF